MSAEPNQTNVAPEIRGEDQTWSLPREWIDLFLLGTPIYRLPVQELSSGPVQTNDIPGTLSEDWYRPCEWSVCIRTMSLAH